MRTAARPSRHSLLSPLSRFAKDFATQPLLKARTPLVALTLIAASAGAYAQQFGFGGASPFFPGLLVVSRSVYDNLSSNVQPGTVLPPDCPAASGACGAASGATNDGTYPYVWNNVLYDANFGITSRIFLDQLTPSGGLISSLEVPNSLDHQGNANGQLVTSFSSKSELALHLSTDGQYLSFVGYVAPVNSIDVSNANTPGVIDPTNPDGQTFYRGVALVDSLGHFRFTETNAFSGDNGRAAILNNTSGQNLFYTTGNAGNGANPQPDGVVIGTGAQLLNPSNQPEAQQNPGTPTPLGSFSVTQLGAKADKIGKDDNFRGITVYNNVVYYTKGSGSNGVNTVYFLDTTGTACPSGTGVPAANAKLPTTPLAYTAATLQTTGLPNNMCILAGFPSTPNKTATTLAYPFGLWFANATTLYVADEGDGYTGGTDLFTHAAAQTTAGLQKWVYNASSKQWTLAYTLQNGLNLGTEYTVPGYPTGSNSATGLPWAPATDGLRSLTGRVEDDGSVTLWAITSTVSGDGDVGADPNRLVAIRDVLKNNTAASAANEKFVTLRGAGFGEVLRGVSFTPGTHANGWF
ncbi:MAG: hypothetical protein WCA85_09570 [Paraburkholderia sp.]|uniref:hypothetical protein n=1 Tax=Paraburkholderia sp. TaxID=1926495 RepID=UPI003C461428